MTGLADRGNWKSGIESVEKGGKRGDGGFLGVLGRKRGGEGREKAHFFCCINSLNVSIIWSSQRAQAHLHGYKSFLHSFITHKLTLSFNPLAIPRLIQSLIAMFVTIGFTPLALGKTLASAT